MFSIIYLVYLLLTNEDDLPQNKINITMLKCVGNHSLQASKHVQYKLISVHNIEAITTNGKYK